MNHIKTDMCVIGAGAGGLAVAAISAQLEVPTVLVESGKMGGDCLNYGCVPSKSLLSAAKIANHHRLSESFGVKYAPPHVDFKGVHDHVHEVMASLAPMDSQERFEGLGVNVIRARARFISPTHIQAGESIIQARRFVLATGSIPAIPPITGLMDVPYLTNESIFELQDCPDHLLIIGTGPIGVELGQAFHRLGAKVTLVDAGDFFPRVDPEVAHLLCDHLRAEGLEIHLHTKILGVGSGPNNTIWLDVENDKGKHKIKGTHLLIAAGRLPHTEGLGLEVAGIELEGKGIKVDPYLRTTNKRVYAIGDVVGRHQFTHVANYHAGIIIQNCLFRIPAKFEEHALPTVTYTDPELATIGLTEAQAEAKTQSIHVLRWPFFENDRGATERQREGIIKVITSPTGTVLGAVIFGQHAGELITLWQLAVQKRMNIKDMAQMIVPYPTYSEVSKRVATTFYAPKLFSRWTKMIVWLLSKFG